MGDILPMTLNLLLSMRGCLFGAKVWFGMLGALGCGPGGAHMQHVPVACACRSPLVNANSGRNPAQAQTAAASVWEGCWRTKAGGSSQAPIDHLSARCLSWPMPGVVSINFDAADCNAGRREELLGSANFLELKSRNKSNSYRQHSSRLTLEHLPNSPPPARSRWPPGHILGSTCRPGVAAGGLGHTEGELGWLTTAHKHAGLAHSRLYQTGPGQR
eukprot:531148-Pelagomonas_calceolata.AAC.6